MPAEFLKRLSYTYLREASGGVLMFEEWKNSGATRGFPAPRVLEAAAI